MIYQGSNKFRFDPAEKAEIWDMLFAVPSDPNGPPDLDAFDKLIVHLESTLNREVEYHVKIRGGH